MRGLELKTHILFLFRIRGMYFDIWHPIHIPLRCLVGCQLSIDIVTVVVKVKNKAETKTLKKQILFEWDLSRHFLVFIFTNIKVNIIAGQYHFRIEDS